MYDEIVCDLLPVNIVITEYFSTKKSEIEALNSRMEQLESDIDNLQEENVEDFAGYEKTSEIIAAYNAATCKAPMSGEKDIILKLLVMPTNNKAAKAERDSFVKEHPEVFGDWNKIGKADINRRIKEIESYHPLLPDTLEIFRKYIDLNDDLSTVKAELKAKTIALTEAVVAKYAALTEGEIKTLVVERK